MFICLNLFCPVVGLGYSLPCPIFARSREAQLSSPGCIAVAAIASQEAAAASAKNLGCDAYPVI